MTIAGEEKLKRYIKDNNLAAEHLHFDQSCHSVEDAAKAVGGNKDEFVKNICLFDDKHNLIVAIVKGEDKVSLSKISAALGIGKLQLATPAEILEKTGYPCGGTPSFGFKARFLIDPRVMEKKIVYTGGGSQQSLVRISSQELERANNGELISIRK